MKNSFTNTARGLRRLAMTNWARGETMQHVALCLPITADGLGLLGLKKRGFGQGKLVGLGGKL